MSSWGAIRGRPSRQKIWWCVTRPPTTAPEGGMKNRFLRERSHQTRKIFSNTNLQFNKITSGGESIPRSCRKREKTNEEIARGRTTSTPSPSVFDDNGTRVCLRGSQKREKRRPRPGSKKPYAPRRGLSTTSNDASFFERNIVIGGWGLKKKSTEKERTQP